jgi:hypothetical protein
LRHDWSKLKAIPLSPTMSSTSPSRILVTHTYAAENGIPSHGEVIVVRFSHWETLFGPGSTLGSGRDLPSRATRHNYHHAVVIDGSLDMCQPILQLRSQFSQWLPILPSIQFLDCPLRDGCLANSPTIKICTSRCHMSRYPLSRRRIHHSRPRRSSVMVLNWVGGRPADLAGYKLYRCSRS